MLRAVYHALPRRVQAIADFCYYFPRFVHSHYPHEIGLALSVNCQAKCIYCPAGRAREIPRPRLMETALAEKIAADLARYGFCGLVNFSDNGESMLNPHAVDIIRHLRASLPRNEFTLFTNMAAVGKDAAAGLLSSGINRVTVCIDGASQETYRYMKGLDLSVVRENLRQFIALRDRTHSRCRFIIYIISAYNYHTHVLRNKSPFPDDTREVIEDWSPLLSEGDIIGPSPIIGFWAVPPQARPVNRNRCFHLDQISSRLIISSNGTTYLCCIDDNNRTAFGNLNKQTIAETWSSPKRRTLLRTVLLRQYGRVGEPCLHCVPDFRIAAAAYQNSRLRNHR